MKQVGFTVVELVVVITIIGILMVLGTVQIIDSQSKARDTERKSDIETIAMHLENLYQSGNYDDTDPANHFVKGKYPSTADMASAIGGKAGNAKKLLRDIDIKSLYSPGNSGEASNVSLKVATSETAPNDSEINSYTYQPLDKDGSLCAAAGHDCRSFKLYAWLENSTDESPNYLYTIESKNQ